MRFIINFLIFGMIFFLIYRFFPEAFSTLVTWANAVYDAAAELIVWILDKIKGATQHTGKA